LADRQDRVEMVEVEIAHRPAGYVLVRVEGAVDMSTRLPVVGALGQVGNGADPVVVDLCGVRFFSLAGVDWVDATVVALTARRRAVRVVCAGSGPVWRLVRLLELDRRWSVHHEVPHAVASLAATRR
jgi:hypothetical protein